MQLFSPMIAAQLDLFGGLLGVVAAVIISFVAITLVASYYRFQNIVKMAEDTQPEDMGASTFDVLRVQLARYLAGCARRGTSFSVSLIHVGNEDVQIRMGTPVYDAVKQAARIDDVTCVFDAQTVVLITEAEPEDSVSIVSRIIKQVAGWCPDISEEQLRVGISSYPAHGLSGKDLIAIAQEGLEQATAESPVVMPEIVDIDEEEEENAEESVKEESVAEEPGDFDLSDETDSEEKASSGWKDRRKNAMLDELTGVLKPSAVSAYMQRTMSEFRRQKKQAALFCVGANNMDHIARFHGDDAADDVLVGVSKILQDNLRADDLIGRHEKYGFLVLAQCSLEEAEIIGRRINSLVQHAEFVSGHKKLKTTVTLGVATYPEHGRNLHQLYTAGQKVLDYSRGNDIRAYAVYDPKIHDTVEVKSMKNIKSSQV